jgi:hypothetical protein
LPRNTVTQHTAVANISLVAQIQSLVCSSRVCEPGACGQVPYMAYPRHWPSLELGHLFPSTPRWIVDCIFCAFGLRQSYSDPISHFPRPSLVPTCKNCRSSIQARTNFVRSERRESESDQDYDKVAARHMYCPASAKTGEKVPTTRDGQLYSPEGKPLKIYLQSEGESVLSKGDSNVLSKLRKLVE